MWFALFSDIYPSGSVSQSPFHFTHKLGCLNMAHWLVDLHGGWWTCFQPPAMRSNVYTHVYPEIWVGTQFHYSPLGSRSRMIGSREKFTFNFGRRCLNISYCNYRCSEVPVSCPAGIQHCYWLVWKAFPSSWQMHICGALWHISKSGSEQAFSFLKALNSWSIWK